MATATPCLAQQTACTPTLFRALELGEHTGQRGCITGAAQRPRARQVAAGACSTVWEARRRAKPRLGLPDTTRVIRCDEAGRAGCWLHRFCVRQGRAHAVVDSARMGGASPLPPRQDGSPGRAHTPHDAAARRGRGAAGLAWGPGAPWGRGRPAAAPPGPPDRAARPDSGQPAHARMAGRGWRADGAPRGGRGPARAGAPGGRLPLAPRLVGPPAARVAAGGRPDRPEHGARGSTPSGAAHASGARHGAGPPLVALARPRRAARGALGAGMLGLAGRADAHAGRRVRRAHAHTGPQWCAPPGTGDDQGQQGLEADDGRRAGLGLEPLAA